MEKEIVRTKDQLNRLVLKHVMKSDCEREEVDDYGNVCFDPAGNADDALVVLREAELRLAIHQTGRMDIGATGWGNTYPDTEHFGVAICLAALTTVKVPVEWKPF